MEGQPLENENSEQRDYSVYRLRSFDEGQPASAQPSAGREPAGEFRLLETPESQQPSDFDEGHSPESAEQVDFDSIKFQRENTLLTNAESYAVSIREEAQLYVRQLRGEVETLNQEAEQRYEEAAQVKTDAEAEAARMIAEAQASVEEIRENARNEGFEAGLEEGQAKRYAEAGAVLGRLEKILREAEQFRKRVAFYTEKDGLRLALLMARKILRAELKINKKAVLRLLSSTLSKLEGKGTFRVWLNPDDHQFAVAARPSLERFLDESQALTLRAQPEIQPGNVLIETDREMIDLTFQSQFYHLERLFDQTLAEREAVLTQQAPEKPAQPAGPPPGTPPAPGPSPDPSDDG